MVQVHAANRHIQILCKMTLEQIEEIIGKIMIYACLAMLPLVSVMVFLESANYRNKKDIVKGKTKKCDHVAFRRST